MADDDASDRALLERARHNLIAARKVLAPSAVSVARSLDLANPNQWTRYESGARKPSLAVLTRFCDQYNVTLDFILRNRTDGLARHLVPKLTAQQVLMGLEPAGEPAPSETVQSGIPAARPAPAAPSDTPRPARIARKESV
jgi:transcriptional regulator with XRE-family HTH domain